mgnify:FL=1
MKHLLSVLILAACLSLSLTGQAHADEHQTKNLDSALFGYWYGESIPVPIGGKMVNSRFTYLFLENGRMHMGPEAAVTKALEGQPGSASDSEVRTGTWTVKDDVLMVEWDNGANTKRRYRINDNAMEMLNAKGKVVTAYQR